MRVIEAAGLYIINKHTEQVKNYTWIYHGMH